MRCQILPLCPLVRPLHSARCHPSSLRSHPLSAHPSSSPLPCDVSFSLHIAFLPLLSWILILPSPPQRFSSCIVSRSLYLFSLLPPSASSLLFPFCLLLSLVLISCHTHARMQISRRFAGTKTDRTVSIVPVSIRFRRVRPNKRQRQSCSVVRPPEEHPLKVNSNPDNAHRGAEQFWKIVRGAFVCSRDYFLILHCIELNELFCHLTVSNVDYRRVYSTSRFLF